MVECFATRFALRYQPELRPEEIQLIKRTERTLYFHVFAQARPTFQEMNTL